jgi:predicted chitinase
MVTLQELRAVMPNCESSRASEFHPFLQEAMAEYKINTFLREAAFLAQIAHESGELQFMEELASGVSMEGRDDLGNTEPGDGPRYKGRGPIQLTGRANYRSFGKALGLDLEGNPFQASKKEVGFRIAALFWSNHGLNELADRGTDSAFTQITIRINGGTNGINERFRFYDRAKAVLSQGDALESVHVAVDGAEVKAQAFSRGGRIAVALRPVAEAIGWRILDADGSSAVLQDEKRANHQITMFTIADTGFVFVRDLPLRIDFDPASQTVNIASNAVANV